jgi:hypothetical protein
VPERIPAGWVIGAAVAVCLPAALYLAYTRPVFFTSPTFLGGLIVFECLLAAVWGYRRAFFPLVLVTFLFAGTGLAIGGGWNLARWVFLCTGALVGSFIMLKERRHHFGLFHALAMFSVLAAIVSAAVSQYPGFAMLKAVSLLLLFVYAGTGARLAVSGREESFFAGLLLGSEIFVGGIALLYFAGDEVMGNPNSLGAVMAVAAPILLWGTLLEGSSFVRRRRVLLFAVSMYLTFYSHSRASIVAAFAACGLMCLALRKHKLFGQGIVALLIVVTASALINPEAFSKRIDELTADVIYKSKDPSLGLLQSRQSPWEGAVKSINSHLWFGSGFGTTENGQDASADLTNFETAETATRENGSSYLTIATWVGLVGVVPFFFLLLVLLWKVLRTFFWMLNTGNPSHPAVPLAIVVFAGLILVGFEDWLFAPGYYLCVFFWSLAFILVDVAPWAPLPSFSRKWQPRLVRQGVGGIAPTR